MSTEVLDAIDAFEAKGGVLACEGERVSVSYPPGRKDELKPILATLRANREQVAGLVRELRQMTAGAPPCPALPRGVKLIRYKPKKAPVAIAPVSVVTDVPRFIDFYLTELDARLNDRGPKGLGSSVREILAKLAEAGLELELTGRPAQPGSPRGDSDK